MLYCSVVFHDKLHLECEFGLNSDSFYSSEANPSADFLSCLLCVTHFPPCIFVVSWIGVNRKVKGLSHQGINITYQSEKTSKFSVVNRFHYKRKYLYHYLTVRTITFFDCCHF